MKYNTLVQKLLTSPFHQGDADHGERFIVEIYSDGKTYEALMFRHDYYNLETCLEVIGEAGEPEAREVKVSKCLVTVEDYLLDQPSSLLADSVPALIEKVEERLIHHGYFPVSERV
ncbi:MAG: hypothetical protein JWO08_40 [Verrucomicrobiaceae bacterium]|nr:hypothetical protein [Verrucomicrobiaceae bacterium]